MELCMPNEWKEEMSPLEKLRYEILAIDLLHR